MKNLVPLMRREWLQHRFAWAMLVLVPVGLALLPLTVGSIELDGPLGQVRTPADVALMVGTLTLAITMAVLFLLLWASSLFMTIGTPRRDHGDRSIEFWMSLPTSHAESLAVPMLVHLLLVPAAALLVGLASGLVISLVTVGRLAGIGEWLYMPWGSMAVGMLALVARVMAGLPLATLWLMPLLLAAMLTNAYFKRWGLPVLAAGLSLGSTVLSNVFGQPLLAQTLTALLRHAGISLAGASGSDMTIGPDNPPTEALAGMPAWALHDFAAAVKAAASPLFLGALLVSALLFYGLVLWRQRGAGANG
jgi:hypothetical protein